MTEDMGAKSDAKKESAKGAAEKKPDWRREIVVDTSKVPDFDYRKRIYRKRLETAPKTETEKVTEDWGDAWNEKSEKWARKMPQKFIDQPGKWGDREAHKEA